jgi:hypothetical protein
MCRWTLPWLIIGLGIVLRLTQYVFNRSLWYDEANLALNIIDRSVLELFQPLDHDQGAPIGFLLLEMKNNFSSIILMRSASNSMPSRQKGQARICMISASDTIGRMVLRFTQTPNRGTAEPVNAYDRSRFGIRGHGTLLISLRQGKLAVPVLGN